MSKSPLKQPSTQTSAFPFHPSTTSTSDPQPPYSRGRQASLSLARSPLMSPATTHYPPISPLPGNHSRRGSYAPSAGLLGGKERTSEESLQSARSEEEVEELERDLEAFDMDSGEEGRRGSGARYDGPFQPPVGNEMVGIVASLVGVMVLAIAAGFTTVYDWVL